MFRTLLIACFLLVSAIAIAADDPRPAPPPTHQPYQCDLPAEADPILLDYQIWYVDTPPNEAEEEIFCNEVVKAQNDFNDNDFYIRFYSDSGNQDRSDDDQLSGLEVCEQLNISDVDDPRSVRNIHKFAKKLNSIHLTRSDLDRFVRQANGSYYEKYKINIYVVSTDLLIARGMHLRDLVLGTDTEEKLVGNLIFVPYDVSLGTLTHELTHAFSLEHVNFWSKPKKKGKLISDDERKQKRYCAEYDYWDNSCNFSFENFMWAGGKDRNLFTSGQKLRMACNEWSALNIEAPTAANAAQEDDNIFRCPDWSLADLSTIEEFNGSGPMKACPPLHELKDGSDNGQ